MKYLYLALLLSYFTPAFAASDKPNIVFILADDLGYGEVGFNGQQKIKTPNLDQLASKGTIMTSFYAGAPVCGPSRATLFYGQHTGHAPIRGNPRWSKSGKAYEMKAGDITLSSELKRAGYSTAIFGKWGMNENLETNIGHPLKQGFDEFFGFNTHNEAHYHWPDFVWDGYKKMDLSQGEKGGNRKHRYHYADDVFNKKALDFIDRKANKEPFFLYLAYTIPHKGYTSPAASRKPYEDLAWSKTMPPKKRGRGYEYDHTDNADINASFAGMISHMDGYIAEIRAKLKEKGIADNTLIFFTSDNGAEFKSEFFNSSGEFRGKKRNLTEGGIRMPTFIHWPAKIKAGSTITSPFALWDVLPTLAEIAGIKTQAQTDGISFYPSLFGKAAQQQQHESLYWEFNEGKGPIQAVRFGKWKAMRYWDNKTKAMGSVQLFNLEQDKAETSNLAAQQPELAQRGLTLMLSSRTEHPEFPLEKKIRKKNNKMKKKKTTKQ